MIEPIVLSFLLIAIGVSAFGVAAVFTFAVIVNWPVSWMGAVWVLCLLSGGAFCVFTGVRMLRRRPR